MSENTSISLGDNLNEFVEEQVASGRYTSASEVVRAGLQLLQEREEKVRALRDALQEGLDSGEPEPFDFDDFLREMHAEADRNA